MSLRSAQDWPRAHLPWMPWRTPDPLEPVASSVDLLRGRREAGASRARVSRGGLSCATCTSGTEWGLPVRCMGTSGSGSPALCLLSQCSQPPASRAGCVVGFLASFASFPSLCSADAPGPGPSAGHRAGEGVSTGRHETGPLVLPAAAPLRLALPSHPSPPWEAAALLSPSAEA